MCGSARSVWHLSIILVLFTPAPFSSNLAQLSQAKKIWFILIQLICILSSNLRTDIRHYRWMWLDYDWCWVHDWWRWLLWKWNLTFSNSNFLNVWCCFFFNLCSFFNVIYIYSIAFRPKKKFVNILDWGPQMSHFSHDFPLQSASSQNPTV